MNRELNTHEQQTLLAIARQAIIHGVQTGQEYIEPREEKALNQRNGCFVTIKQNGQLRGCIGNFQSELPLFKEVAQMAQASATKRACAAVMRGLRLAIWRASASSPMFSILPTTPTAEITRSTFSSVFLPSLVTLLMNLVTSREL